MYVTLWIRAAFLRIRNAKSRGNDVFKALDYMLPKLSRRDPSTIPLAVMLKVIGSKLSQRLLLK